MARVTKAITQGIKMVGGSNVANYSLHFLSATKKHSAGGFMTVVVPHLTLGRASKCQVRYGDDFPTVSRRHAEIEIVGKDTVIRHLSNVNPTLINGQPIDREWYLNNGDEIQLSHDGPKIRYNATPTRTSNIKLTSRMAMFAEQALRPYRTAVWVLSSFLVASLAFGGFNMYKSIQQGHQISEQKLKLQEQAQENTAQLVAMKTENAEKVKELEELAAVENAKIKDEVEREKRRRAKLAKEIDRLKREGITVANRGGTSTATTSTGTNVNSSSSTAGLASLPKDNIYFIACTKVEISLPDGEFVPYEPKDGELLLWSGTGFLTSDHKFITARHVLQAWRFGLQNGDEDMATISSLELQGAKIVAYFVAISQQNDIFSFTSEDVIKDDSRDGVMNFPEFGKVRYANDATSDWAYIKLENKTSKITYDRALSSQLKMGEELYVLGYSYGLRTQDLSGEALKPLFSKILVAQDGLTQGVINASDRNFGPGNSGGPVFAKRNGKFVVVGIVSAGIGSEIGIIVPINVIR